MANPTLRSVGADLGAFVESKRRAYGNALQKTAAILDILYPSGIPTYQYRYVPAITRILEKICRLTARAPNSPPDEESPFKDIAGLGLCGFVDDAASPMPRQMPVASVVDPLAFEKEDIQP